MLLRAFCGVPTKAPGTVAAVSPTSPAAPSRIEAIDWLRGLAVIFMIQWHAFDSWLAPWAKAGAAWGAIRMMGGLPSRMFLLLVGVSAAIRFEGQLARGVDSGTMRRQAAKRGLEILLLAYLFRVQEHILAGFYGGWPMLFKVDILNAIAFSLLLVAAVAAPRNGRPQYLLALLGAALFLGLGPLLGPRPFGPAWLAPLTSYVGGARPMAAFPIFPWGAWGLLGVVVGHLWVRQSRAHGQARVFLLTGLAGLLCTGAVIGVRKIDPYVIRYASDLAQNMGPGAFFYRLGLIGGLAAIGWIVTRVAGDRFSVLKQFGRTSLLVYWIHVNLCYGGIARPLRGQLSVGRATLWILVLIALMLAVSILKTRYWPAAQRWLRARLARHGSPQGGAPVSAGRVSR
jgi:uncharacterized membrane protein